MEIRNIESRVSAVGPRKLKGYAVRYNSVSTHQIAQGVKEVIARNAFARTLGTKADVRALYEHNPENLLGRTSSGTLALRDDEEGLGFELDLPNTSLGNDVFELCRRGDLKGMSFGFVVSDDDFSRYEDDDEDFDDDGMSTSILRTIRTANLLEISAVSTPVYESSSVLPRNYVDANIEPRAKAFMFANLNPSEIDARNRIRLAVLKADVKL